MIKMDMCFLAYQPIPAWAADLFEEPAKEEREGNEEAASEKSDEPRQVEVPPVVEEEP